MIAEWTHLFPSRTQKLSTSAATIAGLASVKIALRRSFLPLHEAFFMVTINAAKKDDRIKGSKY